MTRHWVEANLNEYGAGCVLVCEHPDDCRETGEGDRHLGCCVSEWFDNTGTNLFAIDNGVTVPLGRIEVACHWRGGEDDEPTLLPITTSPPAVDAPAGSHRRDPAAGDLVDWKRIAIKLGQRESDWLLLSTVEADALRVVVDAVWDREAIAEDAKQDRMSDAATGLEGR